MPANLETSAVATWLERVKFSFQSKRKAMPKNVPTTTVLISHASKVMLKILQARFQQYVNRELPYVQTRYRKGKRTRDQIANIRWITKKAREFPESIYLCFIDYAKAFDYVDHHRLWKILQEMGVLDHRLCLLRNLYVSQVTEPGVKQRTGSKLWKEYD